MKNKHAKWGLIHFLAIVMIAMAGSAFAAGETLMHNSNNLGTKYGTWGVAGGKYGQFTCTTCHSTLTTGTNNVKRIKGTITAPLGNWSSSKAATVTVVFNNMTAFGTDAGGHATSQRICEVCHSKTAAHRYNTTGQTDLDHQSANLTDCTGCHPHSEAFAGKGCTSCHNSNVASGVPMATGQHTAHINNATNIGLNYGCVDCHAKTVTNDTTIKPSPSAHRNTIYGDFSGARAGSSYASGNCSNTYCHTSGKGAAPATAVNWATGPSLTCNGCHGGGTSQAGEPVYVSGGVAAANANTHPKHVGTTGASATCQNCHGATMSGTGLNASGKHTDRNIDVLQGNSKTFTYSNDSTKTCSNISCHGNGKFTPASAQWGATLDCSGCHASAALVSGSHNKHLAKNATCSNCHSSTTTTNNTITGTTHIDGTVDLQQGGNFGSKAVSFQWAGANTCNNISCHSTAATGPYSNTATWGGAALNCNACHPQTGLSGAHQVHMGALDLSLSNVYYNMTANRTPATNDTVRKHGYGCGNCHPMSAVNHINGSIDVDLNRVNVAGVSTLRFLNHSTAGYGMLTDKKCSNMYCHSNASRVEAESNVRSNTSLAWTDKFSNYPSLDRCAFCHGNQPTTGAHVAHAISNHSDNIYNGTGGKVGFSGTGNSAHGNPNTTTTITCYICHSDTVNSNAHGNDKNDRCKGCHGVTAPLKGTAYINNLANHVNGSREIKFAPIKVRSKAQVRPQSFHFYSGVWKRVYYKNMTTLAYDESKLALDTSTMWHPSTPSESNCTNLACHNGYNAKWNMANWNDPNKCMDCHFKL